MSYGILWLIHLIFSLLVVATGGALAAKCQRPLWRRVWPILLAVLVFLPILFMGIAGGVLLKRNLQPTWLAWYGGLQTICYLIGVVIILRRGLAGANSEIQPARSWPRGRLALASGLALFGFIATFSFLEMKVMMDLATARAETTARIISLLPPTLPDTLNGYPFYQQAATDLGPRKDLPKWFHPDSGKADFDPASKEAVGFLARHQDVLATLHLAGSKPGYSFQVNVIDLIGTHIPEYFKYLEFARLLSLAARSKIVTEGPTAAFMDLTAIENMSDHLRSFPLVISFVVAAAVDQTRMQGLEYVLAHTRDLPGGLIDLPVKASPSVLNSFLLTQNMEAQGILQVLTKSMSLSELFSFDLAPKDRSPFEKGLTRLWRVFLLPTELKTTKEIIVYNMSKPADTYEESHQNWKTIDDAFESGDLGIVAAIAMPDLSTYVARAMRYDAQRGLTDLALAATAYKTTKGNYPTSLEDLVPDYIDQIPPDPFDGKTLKMKPMNGGVDLYSSSPEPKLDSHNNKGPVHFYLGRNAYEEYRVKPAQEERLREETKKKRKKKK